LVNAPAGRRRRELLEEAPDLSDPSKETSPEAAAAAEFIISKNSLLSFEDSLESPSREVPRVEVPGFFLTAPLDPFAEEEEADSRLGRRWKAFKRTDGGPFEDFN
jgi:hypothetical protein